MLFCLVFGRFRAEGRWLTSIGEYCTQLVEGQCTRCIVRVGTV